ncbi:hypothetical protein [Telluribacter sp. SYSU D00476]|uniref:hypothetical protein n=1 Tax=Telluribacter sp. SYSU D00476 TaxID=2811430 RepID=UPI001FF5102D|nr:hypothetical protein [Telluribacter sp. SYSU D00476]
MKWSILTIFLTVLYQVAAGQDTTHTFSYASGTFLASADDRLPDTYTRILNREWQQWRQENLEPQVRPFITDDARVVGARLAQLETWFRGDREASQQWVMAAYGPNNRLEVSIGGVFGIERHEENRGGTFAYALPLLQAKYLIRPYAPGRGPGFGIVAGSFLPAGKGSFRPTGYGTFSFATISQCFGEEENVLLHLNTGFNYLHVDGANEVLPTWGFGTQIKTIGGFHLVGEIFSGDPYVPGAGMSYQAGYRHFFSDLFQIDMTFGKGLAGANPLPLWFSAGARIVFTHFQKKAY